MAELLRALLDRPARCPRPPAARGRSAPIRRPRQRRGPMSERATPGAYGVLTEPATLTIQRLLPGPIDRVWNYLTQGDLRRQWLAAGAMELKVGAPFEFVWRNNELTNPPGARPPGFADEHRMQCRITEVDPPRKIS